MVEARKVRLKRKLRPKPVNKFRQRALFVFLLLSAVVIFMVTIRYMVQREESKLNKTATLRSRGLQFKLQMNKTRYLKGEPVDVQLVVTNVSGSPIALVFDFNLEFDFLVQREVNLLFVKVPMNVWRYSSQKVPIASPHTVVLEPGQDRVFKGTWDQRDFRGRIVSSGRYIITGFLKAKDRSESLQIRGETAK